MLKNLFSNCRSTPILLARDLARADKDDSAMAIRSRLLEGLPPALEHCPSPQDALRLLGTCDAAAVAAHGGFVRALMRAEDDRPSSDALLHGAATLAVYLRDAHVQTLLHPSIAYGQAPTEVWIEGLRRYLDWNARTLALYSLRRRTPAGCDWHKVYGLVAPAKRHLSRAGGTNGAEAALRARLDGGLAFLLLLSRSLSAGLEPRQTLIAAQAAQLLHPLLRLADEYGEETPFGTDIHEADPPTLSGGARPIGNDMRLFFGPGAALAGLDRLERELLTRGAVPEDLKLAEDQGVGETHEVLRHLRKRWNKRRDARLAPRARVPGEVRVLPDLQTACRRLADAAGPLAAPATGCDIEDASATGFGLLAPTAARWATSGTLLALSLPENEGWAIGVTRRRTPRSRDRVLLGVQILSLEARAAFPAQTANGESAEQTQDAGPAEQTAPTGIYLPPDPRNGVGPALLTCGRLSGGTHVYRVAGEHGLITVDGSVIQDLGRNFVRYACELLGPAPASERRAADGHARDGRRAASRG